jgi:superfamily II DNA or RNA helicase
MVKLEDITPGAQLQGLAATGPATVIQVQRVGDDALTVYFKAGDGPLQERMLFREDEPALSLVEAGRAWSFDADGEDLKLAAEAYRIHLAHLFDPMMAVHSSNVEPLPHQITAVYESMLPRQPLRYVLADDPGAGKTIMAGLYMRELMLRGDLERCLIISPGNLVEQWQDELQEKFGVGFTVFSRAMVETAQSGNPFDEHNLLITRLDQLSRAEDLQDLLDHVEWDLVVVDEAHKLSAAYWGNELKKTKRYQLGERIGRTTRHLLLMTATPHNGKEADFQLFLALLDSDRFYGKFRDGVHQVDVSDLMRRMVKEELLKFDGTPLFPERHAYTLNYRLSDAEAALYEAVTRYVKDEMNRADALDDKRRGTVGFALTILQRRLASSPEAIYQSLKRRRKRMERRLEETKLAARGGQVLDGALHGLQADLPNVDWDNLDEAPDAELEALEEQVVDQATAARTIVELEAEVLSLRALEAQAHAIRVSDQDRKWDELSRLLQDDPEMRAPAGHRRKLIIFTEHKDTLTYLGGKIRGLLGRDDAVVTISGSTKREDRRKIQEAFRNDPDVLILVATDAAGEGVNLQNANLMVNYDLPWNPNRMEQRFGRIHRIGQTEVCHLWNLVANETREGDVFQRLFDKLENERQALGGRVFDILGEVFNERALRDMLLEAIRYGDDPEVRARLFKQVDGALDTAHLKAIMQRNALTEEVMTAERLFAVKEEMEKAEARRLQPFYIQAFFEEAFGRLGGKLRERERGRYEITHVPAALRDRDRQIGTRAPVLRKYERVCFAKGHVRAQNKPMAALLHPGHPLMHATLDLTLEQHRDRLKQGAVLVDPADAGTEPRLLLIIDHGIRDAAGNGDRLVSRRLHFIARHADGRVVHAGPAPYLDYQALEPADRPLIEDLLGGRSEFGAGSGEWAGASAPHSFLAPPNSLLAPGAELETEAIAHAAQHLVPAHLAEVKARRQGEVDKTLQAVHARLVKEINFWSQRAIKLQEDMQAGKQPRMQPENARRKAEELTERLARRQKELEARRHITSNTPKVVGAALVIPLGLLAARKGEAGQTPDQFSADAEARARIEQAAMDAVMAAEQALGNHPEDVSKENLGWDITSRTPSHDLRFIEVKGRAAGAKTVTVTRNEILTGFNKPEQWMLALVEVSEEGQAAEPVYVRRPFESEPGWGVSSVNYDWGLLAAKGTAPGEWPA